ncbi:hypothetical protein OSTOST_21875 [Ostertagia ostertagi]
MSASPTQKRESPSSSPTQSPTQFTSMTAVLEIVVHSVMEGVKDAKIIVPIDATVFELKRTIAIATDVSPEQQILLYKDKELKYDLLTFYHSIIPCASDTWWLVETIQQHSIKYGIVSACTLTMNVKMHTGILVDQYRCPGKYDIPAITIPTQQCGRLRNTIREMTNVQE